MKKMLLLLLLPMFIFLASCDEDSTNPSYRSVTGNWKGNSDYVVATVKLATFYLDLDLTSTLGSVIGDGIFSYEVMEKTDVPIPALTGTVDGSKVSLSFPGLNYVSYEGTLSADGKSISGTLTINEIPGVEAFSNVSVPMVLNKQ